MSIENMNLSRFLQYITNVANQKEFFGEGFKGDKNFPLIILLAKWVYQLVCLYIKIGFFSMQNRCVCLSVRPISYWLELRVMGITQCQGYSSV
jgi:hypothetical protein